jgi:LuxR family maltose regulon positive regulatory protein
LGNQQIAAGALSLLGGIYGERGELRRAQDVLDEAIEAYEGSLAVAMPECALSFLVHYERNELDAAARLQQKAIGECKKSGDYQVLTAAYSYLSLTKTAQGDLNEAKEALKNADRCARSQGVSSIFSAQVAAFGALIAIRQNDTEALRRWGGQVLGMEAALPSFLSHIPSRILIASGDASGATNRLRLLFDDAVKNGLRYRQLKFRVCQALAASDPAEKLKLISDALLLGQSEGFMRSFVDEGVQVGGLIRAALRRGANREYAGKLIRTIESEQRGSFVGTPKGGLMPESGQLSDREMQVLRLLASGLSNREISSRLFVSLGTVNVHVHNILEKLEARSRTQAVAIARELNLF